MSDSKRERLVVDAVVYTAAAYLVQPILFVSNLLVRRNIGPYLAGVVATLTLVSSYAAYANLGMLGAAERDLPYYLGAKDLNRFAFIRRLTLLVAVSSGAVSGLGVALWALWHRHELTTPLLVGLFVYAPLCLTAQWLAHQMIVLRSTQQFVLLAKLQVAVALVTGVLNVVASRYAGLYGLLAVTTASAVIQIAYLARRTGRTAAASPGSQPIRKELWALIVIGAPILLQGFISTGARTVDNILVLRVRGTEALGLYAVAIAPAAIIYAFVNSLTVILFPRMREAHGEHGDVTRLSNYVVPTSITAGALVPLMVGALLWFFPVVVRTFLPKFTEALPAFTVAVLGSYFFAMTQISASFLVSLGRQLPIAISYFVGAVTALFAGLTMHRLGYGVAGIAGGTVFGHCLAFVVMNTLAARSFGNGRFAARFVADLFVPIAVAIPLAMGVGRLFRASAKDGLRGFLVASACTAIFYIGYAPVLVWLDRKTGVRRLFLTPVVRRLRQALERKKP